MARRKLNNNPSNQTVGYLRRSTDRQEQSIPDQKRAIETYATEHSLKLVKFYVDDAIRGTDTFGRRAFQQMIKDIYFANATSESGDMIPYGQLVIAP